MERATAERPRGAALKRVTRASLVDEAYQQLRRSIVAGTFKPGARLIEGHLAEELDVSRGTVRSALGRLVTEGLVVEQQHRGCVVRELSLEDLIDVFNARVGIEVSAIRLCTKRAVPTAELWAVIDRMERYADRGDTARLIEEEFHFHERLCELSGNAYLIQLYKSLAAQIRIAIGRDTEFTGNPRAAPAAHRPLVEAIESGDERRASQLLEYHMNCTVIEYLKRRGLDELLARVLVPTELDASEELLRVVGGLGPAPPPQ